MMMTIISPNLCINYNSEIMENSLLLSRTNKLLKNSDQDLSVYYLLYRGIMYVFLLTYVTREATNSSSDWILHNGILTPYL